MKILLYQIKFKQVLFTFNRQEPLSAEHYVFLSKNWKTFFQALPFYFGGTIFQEQFLVIKGTTIQTGIWE